MTVKELRDFVRALDFHVVPDETPLSAEFNRETLHLMTLDAVHKVDLSGENLRVVEEA